MANRSFFLFNTALVITILIHFFSIKPIATWLGRDIMPMLTDQSIEIDLTEIKAQPKTGSKVIKQVLVAPQTSEITNEQTRSEEKKLHHLPKNKKILDPDIKEDKVLVPDLIPHKKETDKPVMKKKQSTSKREKVENKPIISPLFIKKTEKKELATNTLEKKITIPDEVKDSFRNGSAEKTDDEKIEYSMNSYRWTFERYMQNWAIDIQKWWKAPLDYTMGNVPEGGDMWIQVRLERSGRLLGYRIVGSGVTAEMELMVIQALVGSLERPALPESFPKKWLVINWHFVYPPLRPQLDFRR